ncbi:MAG: PEGA domain-containing protein [Chthoniobacter sp.]|nr:PEGA domain-containing protein [Chthoniobacter sp.]
MHFPARLFPLLLAGLTLPLSQLVFPGCATMIDGPAQQLQFASEPAGATVFLNGKAVGKTPTLIVVSRWSRPRVRIELPGFRSYELQLERRTNSNIEGNLFLGGAPILIDALTGSILRLEVPEDRRGELITQGWTGVAFDSRSLFIGVALKPEPSARKIGQMQRR